MVRLRSTVSKSRNNLKESQSHVENVSKEKDDRLEKAPGEFDVCASLFLMENSLKANWTLPVTFIL